MNRIARIFESVSSFNACEFLTYQLRQGHAVMEDRSGTLNKAVRFFLATLWRFLWQKETCFLLGIYNRLMKI